MAAISAAAEWQESYMNMIFEVSSFTSVGISAVESLHRAMNVPIESVGMEAATASYIRISQMVDNTAEYIQENIQAQEQFNASVEEGKEKAGGLSDASA